MGRHELDGREIAFGVPAEQRAALLAGLSEINVILRMESDIGNFQRADREQRRWIHFDRYAFKTISASAITTPLP